MKMNCFSFIIRLALLKVCTSITSPGTTFGINTTLPSGAFATDTPFAPASMTLSGETPPYLYFSLPWRKISVCTLTFSKEEILFVPILA
jgi:hypothetical protein